MNALGGLGACAVVAGMAFAVTRMVTVDQMVLGITLTVIAVSLVTYVASIRRRRRDRRTANGRARSRRVASG